MTGAVPQEPGVHRVALPHCTSRPVLQHADTPLPSPLNRAACSKLGFNVFISLLAVPVIHGTFSWWVGGSGGVPWLWLSGTLRSSIRRCTAKPPQCASFSQRDAHTLRPPAWLLQVDSELVGARPALPHPGG